MITDYYSYCVSGKNNSKVFESLFQLSAAGPAVNEEGQARGGGGGGGGGRRVGIGSFTNSNKNPLWQKRSPHVYMNN